MVVQTVDFQGSSLGVAGDRGSERGANLCLADERVVGRLGGGVAARGAAAGWVGSAVGAAGVGGPAAGAAG